MAVKPESDLEYQYPEKIIIGTRGSPLALVQSNMVKDAIEALDKNIEVSLKIIKTSGDWKPEDGEVGLEALEGGKAQFAKEIEEAMLAGAIDIAVHSMKDMETVLPEGLVIPYMLPREDVRDAFLSDKAQNIEGLPQGAIVGTASVRRQAILLRHRPDLKVVPFRGNVQTRIDKLRAGQVDATFLACAGLNRLGLQREVTSPVPIDQMLPAVGQGAVGIEMRQSDAKKLSFISQFSCSKTLLCASCERSVLRALGGSCHTPVGVYATWDSAQELHIRAELIALDGQDIWREEARAQVSTIAEAENIGAELGKRLKAVAPADLLG